MHGVWTLQFISTGTNSSLDGRSNPASNIHLVVNGTNVEISLLNFFSRPAQKMCFFTIFLLCHIQMFLFVTKENLFERTLLFVFWQPPIKVFNVFKADTNEKISTVSLFQCLSCCHVSSKTTAFCSCFFPPIPIYSLANLTHPHTLFSIPFLLALPVFPHPCFISLRHSYILYIRQLFGPKTAFWQSPYKSILTFPDSFPPAASRHPPPSPPSPT